MLGKGCSLVCASARKLSPSCRGPSCSQRHRADPPPAHSILGYQPPVDADAESNSDRGGSEDEAGGGPGADGVPDREWLKMRAAKLLARHNARRQAEAAAAAAGGR